MRPEFVTASAENGAFVPEHLYEWGTPPIHGVDPGAGEGRGATGDGRRARGEGRGARGAGHGRS